MTPLEEAALRHVLGRYREDPIGYTEQVLGRQITDQQRQIAEALMRPPHKVLVPAGHELGKTHFLGSLINWHHDNHDPGVCISTAPTSLSLDRQLWKEVRKARPFHLDMPPRASTILHREDHYAIGFTVTNPDAFQGKHEEAGLLVFDEATGIDSLVWERAETMFKQRPGWYFVAAYNPYDPTTMPYQLEQSGEWSIVRLSALDHPNVQAGQRGEPPPIPGAVDYNKLVALIHKHCENWGHTQPENAFEFPQGSDTWWLPNPTSLFDVKVRGRWPSAGFDAVWTPADWARCQRQDISIEYRWPTQIGCDVSRFGGDKTTFAVRRGPVLVHLERIERWRTNRPSIEIGDRLRQLCKEFKPPGVNAKQVPCLIDDTGGYGSGVCDHREDWSFYGINASDEARRADRFANVRAELWWTTRLAADESVFHIDTVRIPAETLHELGLELAAARSIVDKWRRRVVEGKDQMRARLKRSPDWADAVNLAWYPVPG